MSDKTCFVIAPIGKDGSDTRERSDTTFAYIIEPAAKECGYKALRADHIEESGNVTLQVIRRLLEDHIVVADLTDHNPNVFYELAIRHFSQKPAIHLIADGQTIPFDVATQRTILISSDLKRGSIAKAQLISQIKDIEKTP
jgi:hypothetical protein